MTNYEQRRIARSYIARAVAPPFDMTGGEDADVAALKLDPDRSDQVSLGHDHHISVITLLRTSKLSRMKRRFLWIFGGLNELVS